MLTLPLATKVLHLNLHRPNERADAPNCMTLIPGIRRRKPIEAVVLTRLSLSLSLHVIRSQVSIEFPFEFRPISFEIHIRAHSGAGMVADAAPATSPDVCLTLLAHSGDRFALPFDAQGTPGLRIKVGQRGQAREQVQRAADSSSQTPASRRSIGAWWPDEGSAL